MFCQNCKQESEAGKFCTNCGATLAQVEETAATEQNVDSASTIESSPTPSANTAEQTGEPNEFVEKMKDASSHFGEFFLTLVKKPSEAKTINKNHLVSAIITIVIFSLVIALNSYYTSQTIYQDLLGPSASFVDDFVKPLFKHILMFGLIASATFAATLVANQNRSYTDILAKYGAYIMPFMLLYLAGTLFSVLTLGFPFTLASTVGLSGTILVVPVLILIEEPIKKFDKVYIIVGLVLITQIISSTINRIGNSWF